MGSLIELTSDQAQTLQEFRKSMADILRPENDDQYLLKFLVGRKYDKEKAEDMLRKHLRFVRMHGLDRIMTDYTPPEVGNYFNTAMLGYDNEGCLVRLLRIGVSDLKGLVLSLSKLESTRFATYVLVKDRRTQRKRAEEHNFQTSAIDKQVYILDMEGFPWRHAICRPLVEHTITLLRLYEYNYPESLKTAYIVNAPAFFSLIYSWLKSVLPADIVSKIEVLSNEDLGTALTSQMDPSILPTALGGTRKDPDGDPYCPSIFAVKPGTPVPQSMYLSTQMQTLNNDPEAKKTMILARGNFNLNVIVDVPNSILQWDFQTVENDIGMGLRFKEDNASESKELIPVHRVSCNLFTESGRYDCEKPGTYEFVFDNSYSWLSKKELTYKVEIIEPCIEADF